jgi:hypothetical protein
MCAVEGRVECSIILPNGQLLHDFGREVYIEADDLGVWKVDIMAEDVAPQAAYETFVTSLYPIAVAGEGSESADREFSAMKVDLENYKPRSQISHHLRFDLKNCQFDFNLYTTFLPSTHVSYNYGIELPHDWRRNIR